MTTPKIAIFYDWLNCWGGAERLLLDILHIFPRSKLFTTIYDPNPTNWLPKKIKVNTSPLGKFTKTNNLFTGLTQALAVEQLDFSKFDIVISLTSLNGKALITPPTVLHICYCLNPNRYLYQKKYSPVFRPVLNFLKQIDFIYSQRPDTYLTISKTVQNRIKKHYKQNSTIIYPGINTNIFKPNKNSKLKNNQYLVVSRLVPHKKIDIVIETFKNTNKLLYIVGIGKQQNYLKKIAAPYQNIKFLGKISDKLLIELYQSSRALICPQVEDFGLTPLEAQACACPVIALNLGGIKETVINKKTGLLFNKQTPTSLKTSINMFESIKINPINCRQQAIKFSQTSFMLNFKKEVINQWQQYQKNQKNTS
jgi:glycosyltransferase involved in cell wall biosynthesis